MSKELEKNKKELTDKDLEEKVKGLKEKWDKSKTYYDKDFKRMRVLDAVDKGDMWKAVNAKFPSYQVLPDTNFVSYVKQNLLASLYTVAKSAKILPTDEEDAELIEHINLVIENIWETKNVPHFQYLAGERAALTNLGITQVGWSKNTSGNGETTKENVVFKNIDPMHFRRDPFSQDLDSAGWCATDTSMDKSQFMNDPKYKEKFKKFILDKEKAPSDNTGSIDKIDERPAKESDDTYKLVIFWVREVVGDKTIFSEYHTVDCEEVLYYKRDIKPASFPFALCYCNIPAGSLVGSSEPQKILANTIAYNMMDSLMMTAEYKNQKPPKFISRNSGLNIGSFAKYGDAAGRAFIVDGNARDAVHYHEFPQISQSLPKALERMEGNIHSISGIDDRYTGRDTGSIITTGGTEEMLNRVTLIDSPKVINYEHYTRKLTELVLLNLCEYSPKRSYLVEEPTMTGDSTYKTVEVDFNDKFKNKSDKETLFKYAISISSELPKNKQRMAAWADQVMEKQAQYRQEGGQTVEMMTEEEWLRFQDNPMQEYMLKRMGFQRAFGQLEETAAIINEYGQLMQQGVDANDAMAMTANSMSELKFGQSLPGMENLEEGVMPMEAGAAPMDEPAVPGMMPGM